MLSIHPLPKGYYISLDFFNVIKNFQLQVLNGGEGDWYSLIFKETSKISGNVKLFDNILREGL